jgi:hypothetical protein
VTRRDWLAAAPVVTVALLALAASVTSLGHDFTFDDRYVIMMNGQVHALKGLWRLFGQPYWPKELGGDGYRPLVMSLFTLQWVAAGGAPWLFHLVNIVLAVGAALAVQWCAAAILPRGVAWAAAALFAVHPVHVEATGNVVGQSELLVAICLSVAIGIYLRARRRGALRPRDAAAILGLYVLGLLSKEHAIVLPLLLAAAEWTVLWSPDWRARARELRPFALLLVAVSLAYLFVLGKVHENMTGFNPYPAFRYLHMTALDRASTMMTLIPRIGRLLVFPTHLSGDYSPADIALTQGFDLAQMPGLFICLGVVLLAVALRRRSPVASFGLCWLVIAYLPVSNLLVPAGFLIAERTLLFPSVGVVLVAGAIIELVLARGRPRERWMIGAALGVLLVLGLARSIDRQRVWKNNDVFFERLLVDAPNSYRAHWLHARIVGHKNQMSEMVAEYRVAMRLFPYDVKMMLAIAADFHRGGACSLANALLQWVYVLEPAASEGRYAYVECLAHEQRWADSRAEALKAMSIVSGRGVPRLRAAVARADSALGRGHPR